MDWKKLSTREWVFINTKTNRVIMRVKKNDTSWLQLKKSDDIWVIHKPSGIATENAFLCLDAAKNYVEKYFTLYGKFVDLDKPLT